MAVPVPAGERLDVDRAEAGSAAEAGEGGGQEGSAHGVKGG
ncbi:hypothetical protein ACFV16_32250 [Streptomyces massasporeus]